MSKYQGEKVLVIPRALFDELGSFQGFQSNVDSHLRTILDPKNNHFMLRDDAEEDPSFKQLIPYAVFKAGDKFLRYVRGTSGGEKRLVSKSSIGIGGHVNEDDFHAAGSLGRDLYLAGVDREIREEVNVDCAYTQTVVGLLNDDETDVGKVHLGVVHLFLLESEAVTSNEDGIAGLEFVSREELLENHDRLEMWSKHLVDSLDHLLEAAPSAAL